MSLQILLIFHYYFHYAGFLFSITPLLRLILIIHYTLRHMPLFHIIAAIIASYCIFAAAAHYHAIAITYAGFHYAGW